MDYQKFIQQLPELYENWGQDFVKPKSQQFEQVLKHLSSITTANVMQLLNFAADCMESDEIYCQLGCYNGASLIGTLLNHPDRMAYVIDEVTDFDKLIEKLSLLNLHEQVCFCQGNIQDFFSELKAIESPDKIGLFFLNCPPNYRQYLISLLLAKNFLSDQALIIVTKTYWEGVFQANYDFINSHAECQLLLDFSNYNDNYSWNGIQVLSWDVNRSEGKFINSEYLVNPNNKLAELSQELKQKKVELFYQEALNLQNRGLLTEAEEKYQEVLHWDNKKAEAWHNVGIIYYQNGRYREALEAIIKAVDIDNAKAVFHYSLGLVFEKLDRNIFAIDEYQKAIFIDGEQINACNNLGNIFLKIGAFAEAEAIYRHAIKVTPNYFANYLNLGNLLMINQRINEAINTYQKALECNYSYPDIYHNLAIAFTAKNDPNQSCLYYGYSLYWQHKYTEAIQRLEEYLLTNIPKDITVYIRLGYCYKKIDQYESAIKIYQKGIGIYPDAENLYLNLVRTLRDAGRIREAIALVEEAVTQLGKSLLLEFQKELILPILYETETEIAFYRTRFEKGLNNLINTTSLQTDEDKHNALIGISQTAVFYLGYQGKNDLELKKKYGHFVSKIMAANYPEWAQNLPMPAPNKDTKIRIGYMSDYFRNHSGAKWAIGWIKYLHRENFEIYCYYTASESDSITQEFQQLSDYFHHIVLTKKLENTHQEIAKVCQQIIADKLHILVFTDLEQDPLTTKIAALRLAPIQCTAWGYPVTSGLPTIDYYLSSDLMEPENAEKHYSEKLIRLPNLGFSYAKPSIPEERKNRDYFQLQNDAVVYFSGQSLFKYRPEYDYIFPTIALRVPQAQFTFILERCSLINDQFQQRIKRAFQQFNLDSDRYCVMLKKLNRSEYVNLNLLSDIFLDSFSWSGGNTTLEALACNLPVVTCPGEFMRGRHSYGILKMLGVTETIAKNEEEYINIAVKLGLDRESRQRIAQLLQQRHSYLYDDKTCVAALEAFYHQVVKETK